MEAWSYDDPNHLRAVEVILGGKPFRLVVRDTGSGLGRAMLAYRFDPVDGAPIFSGDRYSPGMGTPIDSDESVRGLLSFLSCRPGDTDPEYFAGYTSEQLAFAEALGEELSMYTIDDEPLYTIDDEPLPWRNVDDWDEFHADE